MQDTLGLALSVLQEIKCCAETGNTIEKFLYLKGQIANIRTKDEKLCFFSKNFNVSNICASFIFRNSSAVEWLSSVHFFISLKRPCIRLPQICIGPKVPLRSNAFL